MLSFKIFLQFRAGLGQMSPGYRIHNCKIQFQKQGKTICSSILMVKINSVFVFVGWREEEPRINCFEEVIVIFSSSFIFIWLTLLLVLTPCDCIYYCL